MVEKTIKKETLTEIFKRNDAVISMSIKDGFANIKFDNDNGSITVLFLNDEGYQNEDMEIGIEDVQRVGKFMEDLKSLKLNEWSK
jgi:hypothetical protein